MTQILVALVTFGLPALVAIGSSSRRQLSLIREEVKTLKELPTDSIAAQRMRDQIDEAVRLYMVTSHGKSRFWNRLSLFIGLTLIYWGFAFALLLTADSSIVSDLYRDEREEAFGTVLAIGVTIAGVILIVVTLLQRLTHRRSAEGRRK
ncbi:hypothetical protein [Aeromicrobium erythreum]|uniref:Uncharacterized protein n=1 Tax=Aeromicrobium erythreum TaxID=2041 RepID=A0A0U4B7H4_9ACTN|nr:hypothetical protein [Aeromicrobium erythreum]ALX03961.1 hypothetical protein AERYTH_04210 [Aeromicrobium erythreum]